jgi:hypothetical protein
MRPAISAPEPRDDERTTGLRAPHQPAQRMAAKRAKPISSMSDVTGCGAAIKLAKI